MNSNLLKLVSSQFKLDISGDHGASHWKRVEKIGLYISREYKEADKKVIRLFSLLHDSKRENEFDDPQHGKRAAGYAKELYNQSLLNISEPQLTKLIYACEHHNDRNAKSEDITIQICWDSDRLDLIRLAMLPDETFLFTKIAKQKKSLLFIQHLLRDI